MSPRKERDDEKWARLIVHETLGVPVLQHDDNSHPSMVDATFEVAGGLAVLEIIGDHDDAYLQQRAAFAKRGSLFEIHTANGWAVRINHDARLKGIEKVLAPLLSRWEQELATPSSRASVWRIPTQLTDIGVVYARPAGWLDNGVIEIASAGWSGAINFDDNAPATWSEDVLARQSDVVEKLGKHAGAAERHAFVWCTAGSAMAMQDVLMDQDGIKSRDPLLPDGITHLWVAGACTSMGAIRWSPDSGWQRVAWRWSLDAEGRPIERAGWGIGE